MTVGPSMGNSRRRTNLFRRLHGALILGCCRAPPMRCACLLLVFVLLHHNALLCTPGESTGQRSSPLLMLTLCSCHCPQILVG